MRVARRAVQPQAADAVLDVNDRVINQLAEGFRALDWPVVWTRVSYLESGEDAGVWGTRTNTPDSLQNIKYGSRRAEFDDRGVHTLKGVDGSWQLVALRT